MSKAFRRKSGWAFLGSELQRLFGGWRACLSLLFCMLPFLAGATALFDWGNSQYFSLLNQSQPDTRLRVFFTECLSHPGRCDDPQFRMAFWLFGVPEPWQFGGCFFVAMLAFVSIGSPRWQELLGKPQSHPDIPPLDPNPLCNLILGAVLERAWQEDPGGFSLRRSSNPAPYPLTPRMLPTSGCLVAPPGSGKTVGVCRPLVHFLRLVGGAGLVFDAKGDDYDPCAFDHNFDLNDPLNSLRISLYSGDTPSQAGERLAEAIISELSGDKAYFSNVAKDALATLVSVHFAVTGLYPELSRLLVYLSEPDYLHKLYYRIERSLSRLAQSERDKAELLLAGLKRTLQLMSAKSDALGTLVTALSPLVSGPAAQLLVANKTEGALSIRELLLQPGLVRLGLPVADYPRIAPIIGRLALAEFVFSVLSPSCNREILKMAVVDEAHHFVTPYIARGMVQARSNKAGLFLAFQALSQIPQKDLLDTIIGACGIRMVMAGVSDEDAERFSRMFGEEELPFTSHSRTSNHSSGSSSLGDKSGSSSQRGGGESRSLTLRARRLFLPREIRRLPRYHTIIESSDSEGRRWDCRVIDLSREVVSKLQAKYQPELARQAERQRELLEQPEGERLVPVLRGGVEQVKGDVLGFLLEPEEGLQFEADAALIEGNKAFGEEEAEYTGMFGAEDT